jgi:hypothetical protein
MCGVSVLLKSFVFCNVTPSNPFKINGWFGVTSHLHLEGPRINQATNQHEAGSKQSSVFYLLHAGFLLVLSFETEDGSDMFFRNFG